MISCLLNLNFGMNLNPYYYNLTNSLKYRFIFFDQIKYFTFFDFIHTIFCIIQFATLSSKY